MSTPDPNKWQVRLQGIKETFRLVDVAATESEFRATTIRTLKEKIKSQIDPDLEPEHMRLLFAGKQLDENQSRGGAYTLEHYKIKKLSLLSLVMRVSGGSTRDNLPRPGDNPKVHDPNDFSLKFTDEPDCLDPFPPEEDAPRRIKMSCGHAVDATTLTAYCRSLVDVGEYEMHCPAIVDQSSHKACDKIWEYTEIRQVALLNDAECQWFESKIAITAALQYCDMKECPGCRSFVERQELTNLRVHCPICTKDKGENYDFCWQCLNEWTGPSKSSVKCGREECVHPDLASIKDAPMMKLNDFDVPNRRACPNCGKVVEHNGTGCKMMDCKRCKKEFCFLCLEMKADCLKTSPSSWYGKCKKSVASKQTSIPVWQRS
jgi:hypothetical protein